MTKLHQRYTFAVALSGLILGQVAITAADARPGGARSGTMGAGRSMNVRSSSVSSVNWNSHSSSTRNVNHHVSSTVHHDVNIDVDHHYGWGDHYHPVAAATAAAATAAAIGSYYRYLPANCVKIYNGAVVYYQCGTSWYQPYYAGTTVQYVVVKAPL
jgi:hypothetical protein